MLEQNNELPIGQEPSTGSTAKENDIKNNPTVKASLVSHNDTGKDSEKEDVSTEKTPKIRASLSGKGADVGVQDGIIDLNIEDYREYLGKTTFLGADKNQLDKVMSDNQSFLEQAGNALGQAVMGEIVGGTIEGFGYLLDLGSVVDVMSGNETEWGNFMTKFGQSIREGTEEKLRIHQDPDAHGWSKMADSGWWASNAVSVASTFSMMLPTMAATRGLSMLGKVARSSKGISKGMKATRKAIGLAEEMGTKGKWMRDGVSQAVLSRNIENWMEAHGTFESYKQEKLAQVNPKTGKKFTEEEATKLASQAASQNWKQGWAMLLQDIPQYLALGKVFNPITRKMEKSKAFASSKGKTPKQKFKTKKTKNKDGTFTETQVPVTESGVMATLGDVSKQFVGEGLEEGYQYVISQNAGLQTDLETGIITQKQYDKKFKDLFGDEEMMTSMFFGGLGGSLFAATGPVINEASKSKSRKEYEKNIGKNYGKYLSNSAKQIGLLNQYKAQADQSENPDAINHVIDESMMMVVADALERDQYDQFEETLEGIMNMSEQDVSEMNKDNEGGEFDPEMAKEYIPELLKKARSMKADYFNLRNRYTPRVAKAVASQNIKTKIYQESKERNNKKAAELLEDIGESWSGAPDRLQRRAKLQSETRVNKKTKDRIKKDLDKLKSDKVNDNSVEIKRLEERLDIADKKGKVLYSKTVENNTARVEDKKNYSESEKEESSLQERLINKAFSKEKRNAYESYLYNKDYAEDNILDAQLRIEDFTSPEGIARVKKQEVKDELSKFEGKELSVLKEGLKSVNSSNVMDESQKKGLQEGLEGMIKKEESRIRAAQKKANDKANKDSIAQKNADNANPKGMDTPEVDGNKEPLGDSIEEPLHQEMPDVQTALAATDKGVQDKIDEKKTITLLNPKNNAEAWDEFMNDPNEKKVGRKVIYSVAPPYNGINEDDSKAIDNFNNAKESGNKVDQSVYDNLNIQVTVLEENGAETTIFTRIPNKATGKQYYDNYAAQRAVIIDKLLKGEDVISEILYTEGGELNVERVFDEEGNVVTNKIPENIIKDLKGYSEISELDLVVTDEYGKYVKVSNKKEVYEEFSGDALMVDGKYYKGGVFLVVKKADGSLFPLRLNLKKNSQQEAELLADLVTAITVQTGYGKGKKLSLVNSETTLSEMSKSDVKNVQELYSKIKEFAPKELALLAESGSSGTMADLISLFVYYTPNYKEKTGLITELMWGKNGVHFGGQAIGEPARFIDKNSAKEVKEQLIEFFRDTKRRQFNIDKWNNMPGYREYVVKEGIINTDVKTNEPLFFDNGQSRAKDRENGGKEQRKIRAHVGKIKGDSSQKVELLDKYSDRQIPKELADRIAKTQSSEDRKGDYAFFYKEGDKRAKFSKSRYVSGGLNAAMNMYEKELETLPKKTVKNPVTPSGGAKAEKRGVVKPVGQNNKNDLQKIDIEKRKQQELERIVKDLEQKESVLREKDGSVSKENMKAWQQIRKKIAEAKGKTKRADTSEGKGLVAIKNKPKSEKENPKIISGDKAVVAEGIIEKIISTGIEQGLSSEDILQKILKRYSFASNHLDLLRNHISDRNSNAPEIGNNKQSFPSWRKGKYDSEQSTSNPTQQPAQQSETLKAKKADIERRREGARLLVDESELSKVSNQQGTKSTKEGIGKIVNFLNNTFADTYKLVEYDGKDLTLSRNNVEFKILFTGVTLGGGATRVYDFDINDIIDSKYDYELDALNPKQQPTQQTVQKSSKDDADVEYVEVVEKKEAEVGDMYFNGYFPQKIVSVEKIDLEYESGEKEEKIEITYEVHGGVGTDSFISDSGIINVKTLKPFDKNEITINDLKKIGFTYVGLESDSASAYYEGHPDYKIAIQGKNVSVFKWSEEKNNDESTRSQKISSGRSVSSEKPEKYSFKTAAEARLKAKELANQTQQTVQDIVNEPGFDKEISDTKTGESGKNDLNLGSKDEQPASSGMTRAEKAKLRRANREKKGNKIPAISTGGAQQENGSNTQLENMKKATDNSDQVNKNNCNK